MKHRTLALLLALTLTVSLAACSGNSGDGPSADGPAVSDSASPGFSDPQQPSSAPVTPSGEPSAAPTDTAGPSVSHSPAPSQSADPSQPSPSPSTAPEQAPSQGGGVDLAAFAQGLTENYEISGFLQRMDPADEMGGAMLDGYFPGLKEMDLAQVEVYLCMISFNTGEFSLVEAKNADDAAKVKDIFQARIDSMVEEGVNYPDTIEQWQNNSQVVVNGNYVMLVCAEDCDAIVDDFNALF